MFWIPDRWRPLVLVLCLPGVACLSFPKKASPPPGDSSGDSDPGDTGTGDNGPSECSPPLPCNGILNTTFVNSVQVADLNRDGCDDLVLADEGNRLVVYYGNDDATLSCAQTVDLGATAPRQIHVADFSGDDAPDVVLLGKNGSEREIRSLFNNDGVLELHSSGFLTFETPELSFDGGLFMASGNIDDQPGLDLVFSDTSVGFWLPINWTAGLGTANTDIQWLQGSFANGALNPTGLATMPHDGDTWFDIAVISSNVLHWFGNTSGDIDEANPATAPLTTIVGGAVLHQQVDLDNDNTLNSVGVRDDQGEIFVPGETVSSLSFTLEGLPWRSMALGALNSGDDLDLVLLDPGTTGQLYVYPNLRTDPAVGLDPAVTTTLDSLLDDFSYAVIANLDGTGPAEVITLNGNATTDRSTVACCHRFQETPSRSLVACWDTACVE